MHRINQQIVGIFNTIQKKIVPTKKYEDKDNIVTNRACFFFECELTTRSLETSCIDEVIYLLPFYKFDHDNYIGGGNRRRIKLFETSKQE